MIPHKTKNMTTEEYKKLLDNHDWYFMFSDSDRIVTAGQVNDDKLRALWKENPEFEKLYKQKQKQL